MFLTNNEVSILALVVIPLTANNYLDYRIIMKKLAIVISIIATVLLCSIFFVGELTKNQLVKLIQQKDSAQMQTELLNYKKSFFSAEMEVKVTIPIADNFPVMMVITSDIHHYPFKAIANNKLTLLDSDANDRVEAFFQTKNWLTSREEISLLGTIKGQVSLAKGGVNDDTIKFNSEALSVSYLYNLKNNSGELAVDWPGFSGELYGTIFDAQQIALNAKFSRMSKSELLDYEYESKIAHFELSQLQNSLMMKGVSLQGESSIDTERQTVSSSNLWEMDKYESGQKSFTENQINLSFSGLDLEALTALKLTADNPHNVQLALSALLKSGLNIHLQSLRSNTPWGLINGELEVNVQPGVILNDVVVNPLGLIDYINGNLLVSFPQTLAQQPDVGAYVQMGMMSGVLVQDNDQLTLQSSLDRGELKVNGQVIPM